METDRTTELRTANLPLYRYLSLGIKPDFCVNVLGGVPLTTVWDEMMPMVELAQLYCAVDAFVMATHGEGWGLPLLEAMVSCLSAPCFRCGQSEYHLQY